MSPDQFINADDQSVAEAVMRAVAKAGADSHGLSESDTLHILIQTFYEEGWLPPSRIESLNADIRSYAARIQELEGLHEKIDRLQETLDEKASIPGPPGPSGPMGSPGVGIYSGGSPTYTTTVAPHTGGGSTSGTSSVKLSSPAVASAISSATTVGDATAMTVEQLRKLSSIMTKKYTI